MHAEPVFGHLERDGEFAAPAAGVSEMPADLLAASDHSTAVTVTFRHTVHSPAGTVAVAGDFNDWSTSSHPMQRSGDTFTLFTELAPGRSYRYRYVVDGSRWENDWNAETYEPNPFGGTDSVVDLTAR